MLTALQYLQYFNFAFLLIFTEVDYNSAIVQKYVMYYFVNPMINTLLYP